MPPFVPRKREHSPDPSPPARRKAPPKKSKETLFDAADSPLRKAKSVTDTQQALEDAFGDDDDDDDESLSDEFEDVPPAKRPRLTAGGEEEDGADDDDEDELDWEDAIDQTTSTAAGPSASKPEAEIGDIDISLNDDGSYVEPMVSLATGKKGPSKRERQIRVLTHCLHVQSLMWHNTMRNSWLNDRQVQTTLADALPDGVKREVTKWREAMGTLSKEELQAKKQAAAQAKGRKGGKGKQAAKGRDWNFDAEHLEQGVPNLSQGDPLLRMLKVLTAYWRKRFTVTAPALRKRGYMPLRRLRDEIQHWEKNQTDVDEYGERVENIEAFRQLAKSCEGSRDVGGQLFVALLRGLGLQTRMVANLQPAGIGWSKAEEADPKRTRKEQKAAEMEDEPVHETKAEKERRRRGERQTREVKAIHDTKTTFGPPPRARPNGSAKDAKTEPEKALRKSSRGNKSEPISLDDSESSLSEPPSEDDAHDPAVVQDDDDDDLSIVDVTPEIPKRKTMKKFDRDLAFPTYWTEVCSPVSHKWIPVDPIVLSTIASNDELLQTFEPRGKKADLSKQVICYTVAFSADGTAKDVTVRYLKRHQLPGKTKGVRMAAEKVPIYNKRGKVKKYEEYDWFKTLMSAYERPHPKRTAADDLEEQTHLKPFKPAKQAKEVEKESLQWYKQSAEFVIEQHLRREEAIIPGAEPVKTFTAGKGDKAKEHPVYKREDVATCKTVESWHKEGRAVKTGEQPMKHVPVRAVTLARKREMEEVLRETGEKLQQGLYSWDQTDWIIPPPIENGVIPKNAFGNMDVYVDTMVPKGAVHLPLKGTARICRKLQIDYAEACTGFEFGKQRAVPILTGVVVAKENAQMVREAWREQQQELKRKEDTKRTATALHWWRKMLMGLRIIDRMRTEYANTGDASVEINPFVSEAQRSRKNESAMDVDEDVGGGGFFAPGHDEEEVPQHRASRNAEGDIEMAGGFLADSDDDGEPALGPADGGCLVEDDSGDITMADKAPQNHAPITPISLQSMHKPESEAQADDLEDEEPPKPTPKRRAPAKKATANTVRAPATSKPASRRKSAARVQSSDEDEGSSLSEPGITSDAVDGEDEDEEDEFEEASKPTRKRNSSPQVILSPPKKKFTPTSTTRSTRGRLAKKVTPVRSQYFAPADSEEGEEDDDSEPEVVKPARTTARTRLKR